MSRPPLVAALAALATIVLAPGPSVAQSGQGAQSAPTARPWAALDAARKSLTAAGPEQAHFVQTYVPAGFHSGEKETGTLALALPDCLRWDYQDPYPKSFLVCGERAYAWNPEDGRGQQSKVDRRNQPGLDLLLLPVDELSGRYDASAEASGPDRVAVHLAPRAGMAGRTEVTKATLVVDTGANRLVEVTYEDHEGNRTTFEISGYKALADPRLFEPPAGIVWSDG